MKDPKAKKPERISMSTKDKNKTKKLIKNKQYNQAAKNIFDSW